MYFKQNEYYKSISLSEYEYGGQQMEAHCGCGAPNCPQLMVLHKYCTNVGEILYKYCTKCCKTIA